MADFHKSASQHMEKHPKFEGVGICRLAGSYSGAPVGISILEIDPGVEIPVHTHDESIDAIFVLKGTGEAFVNGSWQEISKGDFIMVPAGEEHGVRSRSAAPLRLYIVHQPPLF